MRVLTFVRNIGKLKEQIALPARGCLLGQSPERLYPGPCNSNGTPRRLVPDIFQSPYQGELPSEASCLGSVHYMKIRKITCGV